MPDRFFLNALTSENRQLPVAKPSGSWYTEAAFLSKYAADIKLEGDLADRDVVPSLPSVFARPIQFYQALADAKHPLHRAITNQWRGLLGMLALRRLLNLNVEVRSYTVPQAKDLPTQTSGIRGAGDVHITTILRNQLPHREGDWETWWMLYCNGVLVGATSPWSIVYTPADYRSPAAIPWQEDGLLRDPISYFGHNGKGSSPELAVLYRWVELVLREQKWGMPDRLEDRAGAVGRALEAWKGDLDRYSDPSVSVPGLKVDRVNIAGKPYHFFFEIPDIGKTLPKLDASDFEVNGVSGPVLILSRTGLDGGGRVYRSLFVNQLDLTPRGMPGPRSAGEWKTPTGHVVPIPYVIAEETFFPPRLITLTLSDEAVKRGLDSYALPLTPQFFEYFSFQEFLRYAEMLELEVQGDGDIVAHLRLPLPSGRILEASKRYRRNEDIVSIDGTPALAVWPDFCSNDWLENFAIYTATVDLEAAPMLEDGTTLQRTTEDGNQRPTRIWQNQKPMIGFALYDPARGSKTGALAGVVLRASIAPPDDIVPERRWRVSVDFGTSSTQVARKVDRGSLPLVLKGRTRFLTRPVEEFKQAAVTALYPDEGVKPPFVTLLARGDATFFNSGASSSQERYTPQFHFFAERAGDVDRFEENVKWGSGAGTREDLPIREYLRALTRFITCEARAAGVGGLTFEWSYPLSLPQGAKNAMAGFWAGVGSETIRKGSAMALNATPGISESEAVCRYLAGMEPPVLPVRAEALSVAVDVGGGSSDIGFWTETRLLDQVSFKLAGNDLLGPLCRDGSLLAELYRVCAHTSIALDTLTRYRERATIICNALLTRAKDHTGQPSLESDPARHPVVVGFQNTTLLPGESPWRESRSVSYLFFTGLGFYLGLHAHSLKLPTKEVNIYFGGRGCSLLAWIGRGSGDAVRELLEFAFLEGWAQADTKAPEIEVNVHGPAIRFDVRVQPKDETVQGILAEPVGGVVTGLALSNTVIVGEKGWTKPDGTEVEWNQRITAAEIGTLKPPPNYDSGHVAHFIDHVVPRYLGDLGLDERLRNLKLRSSTVQHYLRQKSASEQVIQPIFGSELKALIDDYLNQVLSA